MFENLFVVMPTKNEADRHLVPVLDRITELTPNVFVFDDQSEDETPMIAVDFGASVAIRSDNTPSFIENEGSFRQSCWDTFQQVMDVQAGDWVLAMDADEMLYGTDELPRLLDQSQYDILGVTFFHFWNETQFRVDKLWAPTISSRLFRFKEGGEFRKSALACGSEPDYVQELIRQKRMLWDSPLMMAHLGYVRDEDKIAKYKRYMELDGGAYHNRDHLESIMDTNPELINWEY